MEGVCQVRSSLSPEKVQKLTDGISRTLQQKEAFFNSNSKTTGELNFAQTTVAGRVGRVALRPLYDLVMGGGSELDFRATKALTWRIHLLLSIAARIMRPIGSAFDVRIFSVAGATDEGPAAVAFVSNRGDVLRSRSIVFRRHMRFRVGDVCDGSGCDSIRRTAAGKAGCPVLEQRRGCWSLGGGVIQGASGRGANRGFLEVFPAAACIMRGGEGIVEANPAGAPSRKRPLFKEPDVSGKLAAPRVAPQLYCILSDPDKSLTTLVCR